MKLRSLFINALTASSSLLPTAGGATIANAAGVGSSGGGGAFVWRNEAHDITRSELVDLWEAENVEYAWPDGLHTIAIARSSAPAEEQISAALARLAAVDSGFSAQVSADLAYLREHVQPLPDTVSLQLPRDLELDYFPDGATPEGMMRYNATTGKLDVKSAIFTKLVDNTSIAAAWMHEAIYKTLRESMFAHDDSIRARHLNACLFSSDEGCLRGVRTTPPATAWTLRCDGRNFEMLAYPLENGWRFTFMRIGTARFAADAYFDTRMNCSGSGDFCMTAATGSIHTALEPYGFSPAHADLQLRVDRRFPAGHDGAMLYLRALTTNLSGSGTNFGQNVACRQADRG